MWRRNAQGQDHLAYDQWSRRDLPVITNNQANCMIISPDGNDLDLYVTNETFARARNENTWLSNIYKAWYYCASISREFPSVFDA